MKEPSDIPNDMTVLVFAGSFSPRKGGYETHLSEMLRELSAIGVKSRVITLHTSSKPRRDKIGDIEIFRLGSFGILADTFLIPLPTPWNIKMLMVACSADHDIIWTHTRFFITSFIGFLVSRIESKPLVHTEHGANHHPFSSRLMSFIGKFFDHTIGRCLISSSSETIAVSPAASRFVFHLGGREGTAVIPNGLKKPQIDSVLKKEKRSGLGLMATDFVVVSIGRLSFSKGVIDLANAAISAHKENSNVRLVLIGDGELKGELSEMARQSDGSLILTGEKSHEETLEILKSSDLFVSASHGEGGGLTILEAASLGLPIVTTKSGGISESIERQNVGILIEIGDVESLKSTITSLSRSPDDLEKMSAASSTFANTWPSWSMVAKDTARVLARAKEKVKQLRNENN